MIKKRISINLNGPSYIGFVVASALFLLLVFGWADLFAEASSAQSVTVFKSSSIFRIGEKLTYNISFGKINNAGYAETHVASRGKIGGKDAIEIRGKVKTLDLVSAAFFLVDENRTTFVEPSSGLPYYITSISNALGLPKERVSNHLTQPTSNFDLLALIYKLREVGGVGAFPLFEAGVYSTTSQALNTERVTTEAGEFNTTVSTLQSEFLSLNGISELKINFSADELRVPVLIRFKTPKGTFKLSLSSIFLPEPGLPKSPPISTPAPTPSPVANQKPIIIPKSTPVPIQYIENQPLVSDLRFDIGEELEYRISSDGKVLGALTLNARERKLFEKADSLLLTATISGVEPDATILSLGDSASVQVDPDTLTPTHIQSKFMSKLTGLNQTVSFDKQTGGISFGGKLPVDAPIGTHSFLSLIYAMRSFNLKPSKDLTNPVNDTRVAVFWESKAFVFTLRPSNAEVITINGEKFSAQPITVKTDNKDLDALALKVWLSTEGRVPLRFSAGSLIAELVSQTSTLSK